MHERGLFCFPNEKRWVVLSVMLNWLASVRLIGWIGTHSFREVQYSWERHTCMYVSLVVLL